MKIISYPHTKMEDTEWTPVDSQKIVSGTPRSTYKILYSNPSKENYSGVYECTQGVWSVHYNEDEFCTLAEGKVTLTSETGEAQTFNAPESFLIPQGFRGTWEAHTYVRKYFVIYEKMK